MDWVARCSHPDYMCGWACAILALLCGHAFVFVIAFSLIFVCERESV